jgi:formylglycine-generating enzyme required for sulfatase activity
MVQEFEFEVVTVDSHGEICDRSIRTAVQFTQDLGGGVALEMVVIPGGTFRMGSRHCCTKASYERFDCWLHSCWARRCAK